jgi:hypothetical protein
MTKRLRLRKQIKDTLLQFKKGDINLNKAADVLEVLVTASNSESGKERK